MTKRGILHIGLPKTGTTTVQRALYKNRSTILETAGVLYPSVSENHTTPLCSMFLRDPTVHIANKLAQYRDREQLNDRISNYRRSIEDEIGGTEWKSLLFSAEGLSNLDYDEVVALRAWVSKFTSDWEVVVVVREPVAWVTSVMQQLLKGGDTLASLSMHLPLPNYRGRISNWTRAFGESGVNVVSFESLIKSKRGLVPTFISDVLGYRDVQLSLSEEVRENESLSHVAALLLDSLNRQRPLLVNGRLGPRRTGSELQIFQKIPGRKFAINEDLKTRILELCKEDVDWLRERHRIDYSADSEEKFAAQIPEDSHKISDPSTVDTLALEFSNLMNLVKAHEIANRAGAARHSGDLRQAINLIDDALRLCPDEQRFKQMKRNVQILLQ